MGHPVDRLGSVNPASADGDLDRLNRAFGHTGFIHLRCDDVLAQAVSWHRAEQTNVWHRTGREVPEDAQQAPQFDFDQIRELARTIEEHNAAWRAWFAGVGIRPVNAPKSLMQKDLIISLWHGIKLYRSKLTQL